MPTPFKSDPDRENAAAFRTFRRTPKERRLPAFVGAGVSRRAGYPLWPELLQKLHDLAVQDDWPPEQAAYLRDEKDMLWRDRLYREQLGDKWFNGLASRFTLQVARAADNVGCEPPQIHSPNSLKTNTLTGRNGLGLDLNPRR
jgi:hypothetical protein